jgi:hypothetical protein
MSEPSDFLIACNPYPDSKLAYLLGLRIDGGILLKARDTWPTTARVYCHPLDAWPQAAEIVEQVAIRHCPAAAPRSTSCSTAGEITARRSC